MTSLMHDCSRWHNVKACFCAGLFADPVCLLSLQKNIYADPTDPTRFFQQEDNNTKVCQVGSML